MISFRFFFFFFFFFTEFDFSLLRSYVGVEKSCHRLNQSDNKVTPTATWLFAFSRASSSLFIYILNSPQVCNICLFTDWKLRLIPALAYLRRRILIYFEPHHKVRQWHQIWLFRYQTSSEGFFPNGKKNRDYLTWTTPALSQMKDDGKKMNDHNKITKIWRWRWGQKEGRWKSILETRSEMEWFYLATRLKRAQWCSFQIRLCQVKIQMECCGNSSKGLIHTVKASCAMRIQNVIYNFANDLNNTNMHR